MLFHRSETYEIWIDNDLINVRHTPEYVVSKEVAIAKWRTIGEACRVHRLHRILLEGVVTTPQIGTLGMFDLLQTICELLPLPIIAAVWVVDLHKHKADAAFTSNVATNRGLLLEYFPEREQALAWLRNSGISSEPIEEEQRQNSLQE